MSQAKPVPDPNQEPKEIRDFRERYAEALVAARISAEHTATQGWQDLYGAHRETTKKRQDDLADSLQSTMEVLRQRMLTEDEEKALADIKKSLTELRTADEAFQRQVIDPVTSPMIACNEVIERARAAAREAQRDAPLHVRGLVEAMETVIDTMPRIKFIVASGKLVVGNE